MQANARTLAEDISSIIIDFAIRIKNALIVTIQSTMEPKEEGEPLRPLRGHLP